MSNQRRSWPAEKIEAMRKELLEDGATLQLIATREGVSRQWISQLVGRLDRPDAQDHREWVKFLAEIGRSDQEIAEATGLTVGTAQNLRLQVTSVRRSRGKKQKWTRELILQKAHEWYSRYGYTPTSIDWNPNAAIALGHCERAQRFHDFGAPYAKTVLDRFGSWLEMIRQSGLPPAPIGYAALGLHSKAPKRLPSWRPTTPDEGWSQASIIAKALEWEERYGELPCPSDWRSWHLKKSPQRLQRFHELNPPEYVTVSKYFGSFGAMLAAAKAARG